MEYFVLRGTQAEGPFNEEDLRRAFAEGGISLSDLVRSGESTLWTRFGKLLEQWDTDGNGSPSLPNGLGPAGAAALISSAKQKSASLVGLVEANPVRTGITAIVATSAVALLSRWPVLLVFPGIALGVCCGLLLIVRNRPIVGGLLSLGALLIPLGMLPYLTAPAELPPSAAAPAPGLEKREGAPLIETVPGPR